MTKPQTDLTKARGRGILRVTAQVNEPKEIERVQEQAAAELPDGTPYKIYKNPTLNGGYYTSYFYYYLPPDYTGKTHDDLNEPGLEFVGDHIVKPEHRVEYND